jgi:hypothetical protein
MTSNSRYILVLVAVFSGSRLICAWDAYVAATGEFVRAKALADQLPRNVAEMEQRFLSATDIPLAGISDASALPQPVLAVVQGEPTGKWAWSSVSSAWATAQDCLQMRGQLDELAARNKISFFAGSLLGDSRRLRSTFEAANAAILVQKPNIEHLRLLIGVKKIDLKRSSP